MDFPVSRTVKDTFLLFQLPSLWQFGIAAQVDKRPQGWGAQRNSHKELEASVLDRLMGAEV